MITLQKIDYPNFHIHATQILYKISKKKNNKTFRFLLSYLFCQASHDSSAFSLSLFIRLKQHFPLHSIYTRTHDKI